MLDGLMVMYSSDNTSVLITATLRLGVGIYTGPYASATRVLRTVALPDHENRRFLALSARILQRDDFDTDKRQHLQQKHALGQLRQGTEDKPKRNREDSWRGYE